MALNNIFSTIVIGLNKLKNIFQMNFNDYEWHDAIVKKISIDRTNPGNNDVISMDIEWPNDKTGTVHFENVYWANMSLNFGIVARETILFASVAKDDNPDLMAFCLTNAGYYNCSNLNMYMIEFNSTGSIIKIIAKKFYTS